ncbi:MAG: hypothetical protein WCY06_05865 [Flavobacteriaceae bacterium]
MKKTIVFILLSALFVSCKNNKEDFVIQKEEIDYTKKDSVIYIGNKKNRNYGFKKDTLSINLPELKYIDGKANYVFDAVYLEIHKVSIYEDDYNEVYAITKIDREHLNHSGLAFYLEDEPNLYYTFPLNLEVFNTDFNEETDNKIRENEKIKVKVYVSVYKRDNHSNLKTIVVDSIKLR